MILINLLPHREMARAAAKKQFNQVALGAAIVGALLAVLVYSWYSHQIDTQRGRNAFLTEQIAELKKQIKEVEDLEEQIALLRARQEAVESLQADRNLPVHLLNEAVAELPEGMYLTSIKEQGHNVLIDGVAQSNERVSELLRNLSRHSRWITQPELLEIVASSMDLSDREKRRVYNFTVRVKLDHEKASESDETAQQTDSAS